MTESHYYRTWQGGRGATGGCGDLYEGVTAQYRIQYPVR